MSQRWTIILSLTAGVIVVLAWCPVLADPPAARADRCDLVGTVWPGAGERPVPPLRRGPAHRRAHRAL